jgi:hypothetical protein
MFVTSSEKLLSGGHGARTRNRLPGTTFPVWPLAIRLPSGNGRTLLVCVLFIQSSRGVALYACIRHAKSRHIIAVDVAKDPYSIANTAILAEFCQIFGRGKGSLAM